VVASVGAHCGSATLACGRRGLAFPRLEPHPQAETLKVNPPAVCKLEQRADVYVSSLRSYFEAVGGKLKMVAAFPEGDVAITNFSDVGD